MSELRWGICSTGKICNDFVNALASLPAGTHKVQAVAARDLENAKQFAEKHNITKFYENYNNLFADKDVDAIYIGTINSNHEQVVLSALDAGKPVLCEKPMGLNAQQTVRMINKAREKGVFLMEAYWTRFFPAIQKLREELNSGVIGEAKIISANFGCTLVTGNVLSRELGGGATLSLGCYHPVLINCIFFPNSTIERPQKIVAHGILNETGVDKTVAVTLQYSRDRIANFSHTIDVWNTNELAVAGTKGIIKLPDHFWCPSTVVTPNQAYNFPLPTSDRTFNFPNSVGLSYEAEHVRQCLLKGYKESPIMTLDESLILAEVNDEIRRQVGVKFPQDE